MTLIFYKKMIPEEKLVNDKLCGWAGGHQSCWLAWTPMIWTEKGYGFQLKQ